MLNTREKNQKMIELQFADLSDDNMYRLLKEVEYMIKGQEHRKRTEETIRENQLRETYDLKSVVGGKVVVEKVPYIKTPCKKKRPRIVSMSNNIEVNISTVNQYEDTMVSKHMEELRKMFEQHNS